jgi:hypothetical protein
MIYYQYSEKFDKLSDAILWSGKQKKRLYRLVVPRHKLGHGIYV